MPGVAGMIVVVCMYMRRSFLIGIFAFVCSFPVAAQQDSTEYAYGIPVTEDDTATNFPSTDFYPPRNLKKLIPPELPRRVLKALTHEFQYKGWERGELFYDRNTENYLVQIPRNNDIYVYTLSAEGKPVSVDVYRKEGAP